MLKTTMHEAQVISPSWDIFQMLYMDDLTAVLPYIKYAVRLEVNLGGVVL